MKNFRESVWNNWLRQVVLIYSVLYTFATILNSVVYLLKGYEEDPSGNWHELDRAIIVLIIVIAYAMIKFIKLKNYLVKVVITYIPTLLLAFAYVWTIGLRDVLAPSAYRDIFRNYTIGFTIVALIGWITVYFKNKNTANK